LPKYLKLDECIKLLESIDGEHRIRDHAIITLFLNCGMRLSELVGININHINGNTLTVIGKGDKERSFDINDSCIKAINKYLKVRLNYNPKNKLALFLSEKGERISPEAVQLLGKKYLKLIERKDLSIHKMRHTAATLMLKGKADIRTIQEVLGHSSVASTEIYTKIDSEDKKMAIANNPLNNL
jgi:site-specific recombinase XerC